MRRLRGIRYNERIGMNRPSFAMQQCTGCIAFFVDAKNTAYRRHFQGRSAYFTVVIYSNSAIHMIVIGVFALEALLTDIQPASNLPPAR